MKSFTHLLDKFHYGEHAQPTRDWFVLLICALLLLVVSALGNTWLFNNVAGGGTLADTPISPPILVTKTSIDAVEKVFADRAVEDAKYKTGAYTFTDPSK